MENRNSADDVAKDYSRAGIQEHDFAEEFSSDLPSTAVPSSAPSGSSPYASLSSPTAVKVDYRDVAHGAGRVGDTKKLEHALPIDPGMQLPAGFGMVDSMGRPPVVYASNDDVGPGAFPVRSARNTATSRTVRSPIGSYASPREFTNEESKQEDGVPNSAAAGIGVYTVEAQRVPDGNEDGTVLVAEAQYLRTKWYQRRWIFVGLALLACGLVVVLVVVLVVRQPSAASSSSSLTSPPTVPITGAPTTPEPTTAPPTTDPITTTPATPEPTTTPPTTVPITGAPSTSEPTTAPPTTATTTSAPTTPDPTPPPPTFAPIAPISPTSKPISAALPTLAPITRRPTTTSNPISSLTPFGIACNFLSIPNVTKCQSTFVFDSVNNGDKTTGSIIPSEIGLLMQLT
ncbi:hypothetical protein MHU86_25498 [Fragilaria crotonensis]|nr:hypothetical protein MHU86_25498 [Fragilaria crotonensis]